MLVDISNKWMDDVTNHVVPVIDQSALRYHGIFKFDQETRALET